MAIPNGYTIDNYTRELAKQLELQAKRIEFYKTDFGALSSSARSEVKVLVNASLSTIKTGIDDVIAAINAA